MIRPEFGSEPTLRDEIDPRGEEPWGGAEEVSKFAVPEDGLFHGRSWRAAVVEQGVPGGPGLRDDGIHGHVEWWAFLGVDRGPGARHAVPIDKRQRSFLFGERCRTSCRFGCRRDVGELRRQPGVLRGREAHPPSRVFRASEEAPTEIERRWDRDEPARRVEPRVQVDHQRDRGWDRSRLHCIRHLQSITERLYIC